jgi:hypothetical protein
MELRTQTVDKILEALTPALSAELERVLQEARQQLEEEFRKRLESAIHEAESALMQLADAEKEKAVADARAKTSAEMQAAGDKALVDARQKISAEFQVQQEKAIADAREKVSTEMRNQFQETLRQTIDQLGADFAKQSQAVGEQWGAEKGRLEDQVNLWRTYAEGQQQLSESGSQAEMLTRFLNLVEPYAGAVAVYVAKADGLALWKSRGKGAFSELVSKDTIDPESFFKPLVVRDRTVAAVCAVQPYKAEPLDFLSSCLGRAIEGFGMKLKTPLPRPPAAAAASAAKADEAPASAPVPAISIQDEKIAAEARLSARLLVSEIKLYNEQEVRDGRGASDLYARLQKQIDQGRDQYRQRLGNGSVSRDYYHEELVRVLADGEASRLGADYPGPATP